jgi:hypothetical protein
MLRITILLLLALPGALLAQTPADTTAPKGPWTRAQKLTITVNQSAFSNNWQAGGVSSLGIGALYNGKFDYISDPWEWKNEIDLQYGYLKNKNQLSRKSVDRIFLDSKLGYKFAPSWLFYGSLNFLSQFDAGFTFSTAPTGGEQRTLLSGFLAPAFVTESVGLEYKPVEWFYVRFGAGTVRQTLVLRDSVYQGKPEVFGVPFGDNVRNEIGFQLTTEVDRNIAENLNLKARFNAFAGYETIDAVDTRLDIALTAKVNSWLNVGLVAVALHDNDQDPDVQFSQNLLIGFSLINK